ncbi:MAG: hypothetical protein A2Y81_09070 [Nitrospirae bacterium RBG_13_43_8]|nr:MAG: hypothetical protein A2Y81_09070 [Nitrospirae bacterium RBG_13_43_8]
MSRRKMHRRKMHRKIYCETYWCFFHIRGRHHRTSHWEGRFRPWKKKDLALTPNEGYLARCKSRKPLKKRLYLIFKQWVLEFRKTPRRQQL